MHGEQLQLKCASDQSDGQLCCAAGGCSAKPHTESSPAGREAVLAVRPCSIQCGDPSACSNTTTQQQHACRGQRPAAASLLAVFAGGGQDTLIRKEEEGEGSP